jgi:RNase P/RNase MRP subunit POP5
MKMAITKSTTCSKNTASRQQSPTIAWLGVHSSPEIQDPSELTTILMTSLKALFGELESHSFGMTVEKKPSTLFLSSSSSNGGDSSSSCLVVKCRPESVPAIRAALTMPTLPAYMQETGSNVYGFDTTFLKDGETTT